MHHRYIKVNCPHDLGHYVYALIDPREQEIFYIGKASGNNRAFHHLQSSRGNGARQNLIREIRAAGHEPTVDILRYGLPTESECFEVEAALIDAIGIENLTNAARGHGVDRGRQTAREVERLHGSSPVATESLKDPYMLFFVNRTYSPTKSEIEVYDSVRQFWYGVAARKRTPSGDGELAYPTALGVVDSIIVRAYSIATWFPAGTTFSTRTPENPENRWEFVGQLLPNHPLVGRRLTKDGEEYGARQIGFSYIN